MRPDRGFSSRGELPLLQAVEIIGGALRVGCGAENRPLVLIQNLEPARQIGGVVVPDLRCDPEVSTQESGSQLGNQFFSSIRMTAKTARKITI